MFAPKNPDTISQTPFDSLKILKIVAPSTALLLSLGALRAEALPIGKVTPTAQSQFDSGKSFVGEIDSVTGLTIHKKVNILGAETVGSVSGDGTYAIQATKPFKLGEVIIAPYLNAQKTLTGDVSYVGIYTQTRIGNSSCNAYGFGEQVVNGGFGARAGIACE